MSKKSPKIAALIESFQGRAHSAYYLGYFACFNTGLYYEAHDVLEELWLQRRRTPHDLFYKGLIQLTGAFVHLQKGRLGPAEALFRLAESNLAPYAPAFEALDLEAVPQLITQWRNWLREAPGKNPLDLRTPPHLPIPD